MRELTLKHLLALLALCACALAHGGDLVFMGPSDVWSSVFCLILRNSPGLPGAD